MTPQNLLFITQKTITLIITIVAPIVGTGLAISIFVSIFQSATSIQEQSINYVPKMAGVLIFLVLYGHRIFNTIIGYAIWFINSIPGMINGTF